MMRLFDSRRCQRDIFASSRHASFSKSSSALMVGTTVPFRFTPRFADQEIVHPLDRSTVTSARGNHAPAPRKVYSGPDTESPREMNLDLTTLTRHAGSLG
ncbi:hypothetical protein [Caballeronia telluris]|nr:hypothetical protein [Caballeronia telluris]